ncbi:MAG: IclR family transcriptional regulator [Steroidobacteraceae bacterium]|jgi:DNA-binding IclR family transcriptional regulator|nr:IclR family transcriptional regulator [Steroidobacteraceae bacterium]
MPQSKENKSADRTLAILEAFEEFRRPLTLREIGEHCGIPVSTCHALVHTLLARGYLYQTSRRKDLYPTRRLLSLANVIVAHDPYLERMSQVLERLRSDTRETVILGKRQGDQVLYLEVLESPQTIRYSSRAGEYKPLHSSAIGKVMLAAMSPTELQDWMKKHALRKVTPNTMTSYADLQADLEKGVRQGYFMTVGENVSDVAALAAPVTANGELLGVAIAGPAHRIQAEQRKLATLLLEVSRQLHEEAA